MATSTALIVTLQMDAEAAARFTALRRAHFPPARNWLAAHVTLFHALPVESLVRVRADIEAVARTTAPFTMHVDRLLFLGRGVAFGLTSAEALALRRSLAAQWEPMLGRQDRAWHGRLHVTVQNKVDPAVARALHDDLERAFVPEDVLATGLEVWHYVGGPWEPAGRFGFAGSTAGAP